MTPTLLLAILLAQVAPVAQEPPKFARVEGTVVNSLTGDPLRKATVELRSAHNYVSTSDAQGRFVFEEVEPGSYTVQAERVGFVNGKELSNRPLATVKLERSQKLTDVTVKLTPQGVIHGRIVDEDGDPVREAGIDLLRWTYKNGKKELQSVENDGRWNVNNDGSFVIGYLPAGRYYLKATHGIQDAAPPQKDATQEAYVATYFPSAMDPAAAAPIDVAAGAEVRGIELRFRTSRVFTLRGRAGTVRSSVQLIPKGYTFARATGTSADGSFEFKNVPPGIYRLTTMLFSETPALGPVFVTVTDANIDGIALISSAAVTLTGKLTVEDSNIRLPHARISLARAEGAADGAVDPTDGTFGMIGLDPDIYRVLVRGLPDGFYVKAVRTGDQDLTHKALDLTLITSAQLDITLSANGAELSGIASNTKGDLVANASIQITRADDSDTDETAFTDQNGAFHMGGLAPGEYRVFAWQGDGDGIIGDPEFRKRFETKSVKVTLAEKSHESVAVKLITKEAMDAEAAKIP
jgi:hypothetical protein